MVFIHKHLSLIFSHWFSIFDVSLEYFVLVIASYHHCLIYYCSDGLERPLNKSFILGVTLHRLVSMQKMKCWTNFIIGLRLGSKSKLKILWTFQKRSNISAAVSVSGTWKISIKWFGSHNTILLSSTTYIENLFFNFNIKMRYSLFGVTACDNVRIIVGLIKQFLNWNTSLPY